MNEEQPGETSALRREIEELRERVTRNRADIDALESRVDAANHRADASEARADKSEARADDSEARADVAEARAEANEARENGHRDRLAAFEARLDVNEEVLAELQAAGLVKDDQVVHLQEALRSSRMIGAAIGIVMATRKVSQVEAFAILSRGSQNTNRKVLVLADEVVTTGDVSGLPDPRPPAG